MFKEDFADRIYEVSKGVAALLNALGSNKTYCNIYYDLVENDFHIETYTEYQDDKFHHMPRQEKVSEICAQFLKVENQLVEVAEVNDCILEIYESYFEDLVICLSRQCSSIYVIDRLMKITEDEFVIEYLKQNKQDILNSNPKVHKNLIIRLIQFCECIRLNPIVQNKNLILKETVYLDDLIKQLQRMVGAAGVA